MGLSVAVGEMPVNVTVIEMYVADAFLQAASKENNITVINLCFMNNLWTVAIILARLFPMDRVSPWSPPRVYRMASRGLQ